MHLAHNILLHTVYGYRWLQYEDKVVFCAIQVQRITDVLCVLGLSFALLTNNFSEDIFIQV